MKKDKRLYSVIALLAIVGMLLTACPAGGGGSGSYQRGTCRKRCCERSRS